MHAIYIHTHMCIYIHILYATAPEDAETGPQEVGTLEAV